MNTQNAIEPCQINKQIEVVLKKTGIINDLFLSFFHCLLPLKEQREMFESFKHKLFMKDTWKKQKGI